MSLTIARARELFTYDPMIGDLRWRVDKTCGKGRVIVLAGTSAGTLSNGYVVVQVDRRLIPAHRLIWLLQTGALPDSDIDHMDGNRSNNAWSNLRAVSRGVNLQNIRRAHKDSATGALGVTRDKKRFAARICLGGKVKRLGNFDSAAEAHAAYVAAKRQIHEGCTL